MDCNGCLSLKKYCRGCISLTNPITDAEQTGYVFIRPTHCVCQTCLIKPICETACEKFKEKSQEIYEEEGCLREDQE
jgi:hypothetical protein